MHKSAQSLVVAAMDDKVMQVVGTFRGQDMCGSNLELLALVDGLSTVVEGHTDPVQGWREKFRGGNPCRSASGYLILVTSELIRILVKRFLLE